MRDAAEVTPPPSAAPVPPPETEHPVPFAIPFEENHEGDVDRALVLLVSTEIEPLVEARVDWTPGGTVDADDFVPGQALRGTSVSAPGQICAGVRLQLRGDLARVV